MSDADAIHLLPSTRSFMADPKPALNLQQSEDQPPAKKKKRNLPGTPDPDAEVIALSPRTLMATNRFVCEICNKGFQRDQNLQLHRRGHNLPWKLRQRSSKEVRKRVYICPEKTCVHHDPSRALGDLTGIKKHFSRKHGEKKWKCEKCSKKYAVKSDWKAHTKTCGTREYKCDCGTLFSRKDSFVTHRAFCDALAEESARLSTGNSTNINFKNDSLNSNSHLVSSPSSPSRATISRGSVNQFCPILQPAFAAGDYAAADLGQRNSEKEGLSLLIDQSIDGGANSLSYFPDSCKPMAGSAVTQGARSLGCQPQLVQLASATTLFSSSAVAEALAAAAPEYGGCFPSLWMNRTSSAGTVGNLSLSTSNGALMDEMVKNQQFGSLASSCNTSQNQKVNSSHMSATALLQKAAQMGATTSNPSLLRSIGVTSSKAAAVSPHDVPATNEFQLLGQSKQPENLQEFMTLLPVANGNGVFNHASLSSFIDSSPTLAGLILPSSRNGQLKLQCQRQETEHGLTRDFLGVGDPSGRFSEQELASFASIRSSMNLKAYSGCDP
ncbi:Zinc finger protein MAGPIE [Nymphaea thermarum]|nr:Zinc finger protein MAGPIE [Nymphaea thermarum]